MSLREIMRTRVLHLVGQAGVACGQRLVGGGQPASRGARARGRSAHWGQQRGRGRGRGQADVVDVALLGSARIRQVVALHKETYMRSGPDILSGLSGSFAVPGTRNSYVVLDREGS
jgi:hypothetical protein